MPTGKVIRLRKRRRNLVLVLVDDSFKARILSNQHANLSRIAAAVNEAGLRGSLAVVWTSGASVEFLAPPEWHGYLSTLSGAQILEQAEAEISWLLS